MSDISQGTGNQFTGTDPSNSGPGSDSLANGFLNGIPETDRPIVEKYVKDWDGQVTRKFQEIHGQYAPYKELGDIENIQQAIQIAQMLENDPMYVYNQLQSALREGGQLPPEVQQQIQNSPQVQQQQNQQLPPELQQLISPLLSPIQEQAAQQQQLLEKLAQVVIQGNQAQQQSAEDKMLDEYLGQLKTKHGDFDEEAVLLQMMKGVNGDEAVQNWKNSVQEYAKNLGYSQFQGPNPPPSLSGGNIPSGQTDVANMEKKDVRDLVANIMAATHQG